MTQAKTTNDSLQVRRVIKAPRDKVYDAFADPKKVAKWYHPGPMRTEVYTWNPKTGGDFHIAMIADAGEMAGTHVARGTFTEVVAGEKLLHTWRWDGDDPNMNTESLVTVELRDVEGGTEVVLTHTRLPSAESVQSHTHGWTGTLENLAAFLDA